MMCLESVFNNSTDEHLATILRGGDIPSGVNFVTNPNDPFQVASIKHRAGRIIETHIHNEVERVVARTTEVLIVRSGLLQVSFPHGSPSLVILRAGDAIILFQGAHGFKVLEDLEMWEVKQGPYLGEEDKVRVVPR